MSKLSESFEAVLVKIRISGSIWVEGPGGLHHSFDKKLVKERIEEIKREIVRLR